MYCPECGAQNVDEAKFCGSCGKTLAIKRNMDPEPAIETSTFGKSKAVSQELKIGIIVGTVIIPLLGIVMGGIYMNDANPAKKEVGRVWLYTGLGMAVFYLIVLGGGF